MADTVVTDPADTWANPDPQRTLKVTKDANGVIHFAVDFKAPGSFVGTFDPNDAGGGIVAYVYPANVADLTDETEPATCLDTYSID